MVRAPLVVAAIAVLGLAGTWSCGSDEGVEQVGPGDDVDGGRIDLAYCTRYCEAQAKANTLRGTREDCLRACCQGGSPDCVVPDAGAARSDAGETPDSGGAPCPLCGSACCPEGQGCHVEPGGTPQCVKACTKGADCATGCCAPATNARGEPVGPYVCKPNDGKPYHCCNGVFNTCSGGGEASCCVTDPQGNTLCATKCDTNAQCGDARCVGYEFRWTQTSCSGPTACGP